MTTATSPRCSNKDMKAWEAIYFHLLNYCNEEYLSKSEMKEELDYDSTRYLNKRKEKLLDKELLEKRFNEEEGRTEYRAVPLKEYELEDDENEE